MSNRQSTKRTATAARPTPPEQAETSDAEHTVAKVESLNDIAEKAGIPTAHLKRINAIKRRDLIWPGVILHLK